MSKPRKYQLKIKTKIMLLTLGFSALLIAIILPTMFYGISGALKENLSNLMEETIITCEENLFISNGEIVLDNQTELEKILLRNGGIVVRIVDEDDNIIYESYGADDIFRWSIMEEQFWKTTMKIVEVGYEKRLAYIQVVGNIYYNNVLHNLFIFMLWSVPGYLIVAAVFSYFMAVRMLRPISNITSTAREIKNGDLKRRIEGVNKQDELGKLAAEFNEMIEKIDESYTREKRFTSDASHELRTPLSIVEACVEEAQNTTNPDIINENLETIQYENDRMRKIISQLLTLSRGYEGRYNFEPEIINVREAVDSVTEILEENCLEKKITIHNNVDKAIEIVADQGMYTQVLINIIGNSIKYGIKGGNIWIDANSDNSYFWLEVKDDGIGISEENLPHIFERFYRADSARNRDGSGLGLSIVAWIVEVHKGDIKVTSKVNGGTTMKIGISSNLK